MPFNAFVVYETVAPHLVRGFGFNQVQADARAAENAAWSAHQGLVNSISDSAISGDFFFDPVNAVVSRVALTAADMVAERRNTLLTLLKAFERIQGLAAWSSGELNGAGLGDLAVRAKSYSRWVEMMARATAVDANLSNDSRHAILLREAGHPGRVWYWLHWAHGMEQNGAQGNRWSGGTTFGESRLGWIWYSTTGPDVIDPTVRIADADALNPNTRGYVAASQVIDGAESPSVAAGADFNWVNYLS